MIANGVTINGAAVALPGRIQGSLTSGTVYTVISNTSANPISGTFSNLADGAIVSVNGNNLQASYEGGDGNDLTLTLCRRRLKNENHHFTLFKRSESGAEACPGSSLLFQTCNSRQGQAKEPTIMYPSIPLRATNSFRRISINRSARQRRNILRAWAAAPTLVFLLLASATAFADSATWTGTDPICGICWIDELNWTPDTIPNGPADTATFDVPSKSAFVVALLLKSTA